jgi:hypothetical protein
MPNSEGASARASTSSMAVWAIRAVQELSESQSAPRAATVRRPASLVSGRVTTSGAAERDKLGALAIYPRQDIWSRL